MNRYEAAFAGVHATPEFKDRLYARLDRECRQLADTPKAQKPMFSRKRKALLIFIAAAFLLLSACAAYAVYWSSTQRAKDYSQSEQAVDDRLALAEQRADATIAGTMYYSPIDQKAEVDGISFQFKGLAYWPNDQPPQVYLVFDATDSKTGDESRLYDFEYVLTIDGKSYPAYAKADGTPRALPAIAQADAMDAQYETWFRVNDQPVVDQTKMNLSGTLYEYDQKGTRGKAIGSFSVDTTYRVQTEQMQADRKRLIAELLGQLEHEAANTGDALKQLPDEMTQLNITQEEYTFNDAQVSKDGLLLGVTRVTDGSDAAVFYMDGYRLETEPVSHIFTPDITRPRQDAAWEVEYFGTMETITRYPWYVPADELPETVLIAVLRDAGTAQRTRADINGYYEGEKIDYAWDAVELLLRVNPRTGEVTLPKDDAERAAWRAETLRLAEDGRNDDHVVTLSGAQTINGVTVELKQLLVQPNRRIAYISCMVDGIYYPIQLRSCLMRASINGEWLDASKTEERLANESFSQERAKSWVESNDGWHINNDRLINQEFGLSLPRDTWKQDFTLRLTMDVYDRDENWNLVFIGSFDISTTIKQGDIASGSYEEIYDLLL